MRPNRKSKIVAGLGIAVVDHLAIWESVKRPVVKNKVVQYDMQVGGKIATALVAVSCLGGQSDFWGLVGDDYFGNFIVDGLKKAKVKTKHLLQVKKAEGPAVLVCVDAPTGERYFNMLKWFPEPDNAFQSFKELNRAGCLIVDFHWLQSSKKAVLYAKKMNIPVVGEIDGKINKQTREILQHIDYSIASQYCMASLGGGKDYRKACRVLMDYGARVAVITLGSRGLIAFDGKRYIEKPAYKVPVVDTTGAGDVFHGAFCFGLVHNFSLETNLTFSSAVAALKCRALGGQAVIPDMKETIAFLKNKEDKNIGLEIQAKIRRRAK